MCAMSPSDRGEQVVAALRIERVTVVFGGVRAVSDLSMTAPEGSVVSIIGPNGAGKTTLLNAVSGFARTRSGSIHCGEVDLTHAPAARRASLGIARTFQNLQLFRSMSLLDNVVTGSHTRLRTGVLGGFVYWPRAAAEDTAARARAMDVLDQVGIARYAHRPAGSLPFGVQKMAGVARALAMTPRILLLDEPAAGMTQREVDAFAEFVLSVRAAHALTVVLVEHNMSLVMGLSDSIVVMNGGALLAEGKPTEIRENPAVLAAYLGAPGK